MDSPGGKEWVGVHSQRRSIQCLGGSTNCVSSENILLTVSQAHRATLEFSSLWPVAKIFFFSWSGRPPIWTIAFRNSTKALKLRHGSEARSKDFWRAIIESNDHF